jgi:hypothetical protein
MISCAGMLSIPDALFSLNLFTLLSNSLFNMASPHYSVSSSSTGTNAFSFSSFPSYNLSIYSIQ